MAVTVVTITATSVDAGEVLGTAVLVLGLVLDLGVVHALHQFSGADPCIIFKIIHLNLAAVLIPCLILAKKVYLMLANPSVFSKSACRLF